MVKPLEPKGAAARGPGAALAVHVLTASGAGIALMALLAAAEERFAACFAWLAAGLAIDALDGPLARRFASARSGPINGDTLDLVVDFTTYVLVPAFVLARSDLVADPLRAPLALAIVVASALYFADERMKLPGHWFRGFPAAWNALVFVLLAAGAPQALNAACLVLALLAMALPVPFVHPVRVARLRAASLLAGLVWAGAAVAALLADLEPSAPVVVALVVSSLYFALAGVFRGGAG